MSANQPTTRTLVKSVALPSEHGGWGFLLEPILLGLWVAWSGQGFLLAVATLGVFLVHQPLKVTIKDWLKGRRPERTLWAERFIVLYGLVALVPFVYLLISTDRSFLIPIALAVPLALLQVWYDSRNQSRRLLPELAGAAAIASSVASIAMLGGWELAPSLLLWGIISLRVLPSVIYVRCRLQLEHGEQASPMLAWGAHLTALGLGIAFASLHSTHWLTPLAFVVLLVRALLGLSEKRKAYPPKVIGFQEIGYGVLTAFLVAVGYHI